MNTNYKKVLLGDVVKINSSSYSAKDNLQYVNYLDTGNITDNVIDEIQRIDLSIDRLPSRAKRKVKYNSIIYSTVRPNQRHFGIIKEQPENFLVSTGFAVIDVIEELADADFIYYWLTQNKVVDLLHAIAEQSVSAYPSIKPSNIETLEILLPELHEQKRIASMLNVLSKKIVINNSINSNLEKQLSLIYHNYFDNETRYVELGTVVETTSGGTPSRKNTAYYSDANICWVKSKELLGSYIIDTEEHINDLAINKSSAKLLPAHSVLIAMYGATVGAYGVTSKTMACNQAICALLENEKYPYTYLYQLAKESQQVLMNMAVGSAQQNVSQILIKQLHIHSNIVKVQSFHNFALPIHQKIESIQFENKALENLRNCLLPKLMSGELDVSDINN